MCTKIDPGDLKARSRVLINKLFRRTLKLHRFKLLMVPKKKLNYRFSSLKKKQRAVCLKIMGFKFAEALDLISWLDFILDNLFLCFARRVCRQMHRYPHGYKFCALLS
jgi:hypothetical protein